MKNSILLLTFLHCWLLVTPSHTPADQVNKNSVILKEVRGVKDSQGALIAKESIYGGGISGNQSDSTSESDRSGVALRELRAPTGTFTFRKGETSLTATVIPLVARNHHGMWIPAKGKWEFQDGETNSYESVIHVKMGGDLDIVYQSTEMLTNNKEHVLHYGLSGNPHAVSLSRTRLNTVFPSQNSSSTSKPILQYQPADDIILVQMEFTPEGFLIQPIFDYQVKKQ